MSRPGKTKRVNRRNRKHYKENIEVKRQESKEIMRIGTVGSHGTGKSSLVKEFINVCPGYYTPLKEESRIVASRGLGLNFKTTLETQEAFLEAMLEMLADISNKENTITSRTLVDLLAYNQYFYNRPKYGITKKFIEKCQKVMLQQRSIWNLYVYVPIEFSIETEDEFRVGQKADKQYQQEVDTHILTTLNQYEIPHIIVRGTVQERVEQILERLNEKNSYKI